MCLYQAKLPQIFWCYAVQQVVHIITLLLHFKCSYTLLYDKPPNMIHLKVFDGIAYVNTIQNHITEF